MSSGWQTEGFLLHGALVWVAFGSHPLSLPTLMHHCSAPQECIQKDHLLEGSERSIEALCFYRIQPTLETSFLEWRSAHGDGALLAILITAMATISTRMTITMSQSFGIWRFGL